MSDSTTTRTAARAIIAIATILLFTIPSLFSAAAAGTLTDTVDTGTTTSVIESVADVAETLDSDLAQDVEETTETVVDTVEETAETVVDTVEETVETVIEVVDDTKEQVEKIIEDPEGEIKKVIEDVLPGDSNEPDSSDSGTDAAPSDDEAIAPPPANPEPDWKNPTWNTPTMIGAESPHGRTRAVAAPSSPTSSTPDTEPLVAEAFSSPFTDSPLVARPLHPLRSLPLLAAIAAGLLVLATVGHAANARVTVRSHH